MPRFPKDEAKIIILARKIVAGMTANPTRFPNPPFKLTDLAALIALYDTKNDSIQIKKAAWMHETQDKNEIVDQIAGAARDNVDYGEIMARDDNAALEEFGWGVRAAPQLMQLPGQSRAFEIIGQGDAWFSVDWKEPIDGGEVASYIVQRSEDGINFDDEITVTESEATLTNQPTGKKLIYQVIAVNKAGRGLASNTVTISF